MRDYSNYLKKYPWLKGYDSYPESEDDISTCALNWIPEGWSEAFGDLMCEELDIALRKTDQYDEAYVVEAKEKYASLRLWLYPSNEEIENILLKYEMISEHVCECCGCPDSDIVNLGGWISVYCRKCYSKINADGRYKLYDEVADGNPEMPTVVKWSRYGKDGRQDFEIDISETVNKVREHWKARVANGEINACRQECEEK